MQFSERNWVLVELGASYYSLGDYENSKIYLDKLLMKILSEQEYYKYAYYYYAYVLSEFP